MYQNFEVFNLFSRISQPTDQNDEDYVFEKLEGSVVGKIPGQINGEDFAIDNCKVCTRVVFSCPISLDRSF